jgi:inner membrane protein
VASAFTHALVGAAIAFTLGGPSPPRRLFFLAAVCAALPDADALGYALGVKYGGLLGHRGLSHSLAFALVTGMLVTAVAFRDLPGYARRKWAWAAVLAIATASHGVLDALTDGGLGVAFFSPFNRHRWFFPWRPIACSPISVRAFFSGAARVVLASEMRWVWLPTLAVVVIVRGIRRARRA